MPGLVGGVAAVSVDGGLLSYEVLDGATQPVHVHGRLLGGIPFASCMPNGVSAPTALLLTRQLLLIMEIAAGFRIAFRPRAASHRDARPSLPCHGCDRRSAA